MTDEKKPSAAATVLVRWLTVDNVTESLGIALLTAGASMFSTRAGFLTCGSLLIGLTILQNVLDVKLRSR